MPDQEKIDRLLEAADITPGEPRERALRRFAPTGALTASQALEDDRSDR